MAWTAHDKAMNTVSLTERVVVIHVGDSHSMNDDNIICSDGNRHGIGSDDSSIMFEIITLSTAAMGFGCSASLCR